MIVKDSTTNQVHDNNKKRIYLKTKIRCFRVRSFLLKSPRRGQQRTTEAPSQGLFSIFGRQVFVNKK